MRASLAAAITALLMPLAALAADPPYGLKPGKPYAGQTVNVMAVVTPQFQGLQARDKEFTDLTGIKVNWTYVPFDSLQERLSTLGAASDSSFDVVNYLDTWGPPNDYWLLPLDDLLKRDGISMDRYPPAFAKSAMFEGKVMGFPLRAHAQLMYYRRDIFDKLGLQPPTTWEDVRAAAKRIREANLGIQPVAMYYRNDGSRQNLFVWVDFIWGAGAQVFDKNFCPGWTSPAALQASVDYIGLIKDGTANPDSVAFNEEDGRISMEQGKSAMYPSWWWVYSAMQNPKTSTLKKEQIGFTGMPRYNGSTVSYAISMPFSINKNSAHQEAAWEFMKWVSNPDLEKQNAVVKTIGDLRVENNVVTHIANLQDADVNRANDDIGRAALASLAHSDIMPQLTEWPEVGDLLSAAIASAAAGGDTRKLMLDAADQAIPALQRNGHCVK